MMPSDPTFGIRNGRPSRTRTSKFNARPRSGTLAEQGSGKVTPVCPEAFRKPLRPVGMVKR